MEKQTDIREAPSLLVSIFRQFTRLMQDELALARAEVSRNISRAGIGIALLALAAILALTALHVLAAALVAYLAETTLAPGTAALVVGGGILVVAVIIALVGRSRLTAAALRPTHTERSVKRDIEAMKEASHG